MKIILYPFHLILSILVGIGLLFERSLDVAFSFVDWVESHYE